MRIFIGIFVALFIGACTITPPFQCASSDPDFCEMEIKAHYEIERLKWQSKMDKQCRFIHGERSVNCR